MINAIALVHLGAARKEKQEHQRQAGNYARPAQKNPASFDAFQKFVDKNQQKKNQHAKLKKHAQLVVAAQKAFDKHKFVERQNAKDETLDNRVGQVEPESSAFFAADVGF
jgi:hypothetical protein